MSVIDEYIASCPAEIRPRLEETRAVIREVLPDAVEKISWNMPTFYQQGNVVHFAAHKKHLGFYPSSSGIEQFAERLRSEGWHFTKGAAQFPYDKPLPAALIRAITRFRLEEVRRKKGH